MLGKDSLPSKFFAPGVPYCEPVQACSEIDSCRSQFIDSIAAECSSDCKNDGLCVAAWLRLTATLMICTRIPSGRALRQIHFSLQPLAIGGGEDGLCLCICTCGPSTCSREGDPSLLTGTDRLYWLGCPESGCVRTVAAYGADWQAIRDMICTRYGIARCAGFRYAACQVRSNSRSSCPSAPNLTLPYRRRPTGEV